MELKKIILIERGDQYYELINGIPEKRTEFWFRDKLRKSLIKPEGWRKMILANGQTIEGFLYEGIGEN